MNDTEKEKTINQINNEKTNDENKGAVFPIIEQIKSGANLFYWLNLVNTIVWFILVALTAVMEIVPACSTATGVGKNIEWGNIILSVIFFLFSVFNSNSLNKNLINPILKACDEQEKEINGTNNNNIIFSTIIQDKINSLFWINLICIVINSVFMVLTVSDIIYYYRKGGSSKDWILTFSGFISVFFSVFVGGLTKIYLINPALKAREQEEKRKV